MSGDGSTAPGQAMPHHPSDSAEASRRETPPVLARATSFAPGSIGNVGPGFDVLGLAVEGIGDTVTVELVAGPSRLAALSGRDAAAVPAELDRNCAAIAARAYVAAAGLELGVVVSVDKGLPLAGGLGGSAASSLAGAHAAQLAALAVAPQHCDERPEAAVAAMQLPPGRRGPATAAAVDRLGRVLAAALVGESAVAGHHLDNLAAAALGGLVLVRSLEPIDVVALPVAARWWLALVTPQLRVETRQARAVLPPASERAAWVQQMANTAALVHAFAAADAALLARALDDRYAEPARSPLVPRFSEVKAAALAAGALGCSLSGAGPTVFAIAADQPAAAACARAMQAAFGSVPASVHVGSIDRRGVRER